MFGSTAYGIDDLSTVEFATEDYNLTDEKYVVDVTECLDENIVGEW